MPRTRERSRLPEIEAFGEWVRKSVREGEESGRGGRGEREEGVVRPSSSDTVVLRALVRTLCHFCPVFFGEKRFRRRQCARSEARACWCDPMCRCAFRGLRFSVLEQSVFREGSARGAEANTKAGVVSTARYDRKKELVTHSGHALLSALHHR